MSAKLCRYLFVDPPSARKAGAHDVDADLQNWVRLNIERPTAATASAAAPQPVLSGTERMEQR